MSRDKTTTSGIPLTFKKIKLLFNRFERLNVITSIQVEFGHERSPKKYSPGTHHNERCGELRYI